MVDFVISNHHSAMVRVQLKDKAGSRGIIRELHDVKLRESVKMQAAPGYRIKLWFIGADEKQLPGTQHTKQTVEESEEEHYRQFALYVTYQEYYRCPYLVYDYEKCVRK